MAEHDGLPEIPAEWMAEAKRRFPAYLVFTREKAGDVAYCCTRCDGEGTVRRVARTQTPADRQLLALRHNETTVCPLCGEEVTAKNARMMQSGEKVKMSIPFAFFFRLSPERLLIRVLWVHHLWDMDQRNFYWNTYDPAFYVLAPRDGRCFVRSFYKGFSDYTRVSDVPYGTFFIGDTDLRDTFLKYNSYDLYRAETHDPCYIRYLCYYARYPLIEQLVKAGYSDFVDDLIVCNNPNKSVIDFTAPSIKEAFRKVRIEDLRRRKTAGVCDSCRLMRQTVRLRRYGSKAFDKAAFYLRNIDGMGVRKEADAIHRVTGVEYERMHAYLCGQMQHIWVATRYRTYFDYIDQAQKIGVFSKDTGFLFPRDLERAHDRIAGVYNAKLEAERLEKNKELLARSATLTKRLCDAYCYEDEHYTVVVPRTMDDIIYEGKALRHCVGGYAQRHFEGVAVIVFIRRKEAVATPYFTVELKPRDGSIVQIHGLRNCAPDCDLRAFVNAWQDEVQTRRKKKHTKEKETA